MPEGQRNATAASVAGAVLRGVPEELWEIAGWGGLLEWNRRNAVPLPEGELRAVFESIARRERERRRGQEGTGGAVVDARPNRLTAARFGTEASHPEQIRV